MDVEFDVCALFVRLYLSFRFEFRDGFEFGCCFNVWVMVYRFDDMFDVCCLSFKVWIFSQGWVYVWI